MKEKLYTIPLNDAINANDECPFCFVERNIEQDLMDFCLGSGSSYMESDVRDATDKEGFCRMHFKKMFDYGNTLGNAWILKTHYKKMSEELKKVTSSYSPTKTTLMGKFKKNTEASNPISMWVREKEESCYICNRFKDTYARYLDTFFVMYKKDKEFRDKIASGKGFCLTHFGDLCEEAEKQFNDKEKAEFFPIVSKVMIENMNRLYEDVSWMVEKFDYRNQDADWKTSKDAIQRGMQKLKGGYPADAVYQMRK